MAVVFNVTHKTETLMYLEKKALKNTGTEVTTLKTGQWSHDARSSKLGTII